MKELFTASEEVLSIKAATDHILEGNFTVLRDVDFDIPVIRKLTRLEPEMWMDLLDELNTAFADNFPITGGSLTGNIV
jgi:hypothetical protein